MTTRFVGPALTVLAVLIVGCTVPAAQPGGSTAEQPPRGPTRIVAAIMDDPHTVYQQLNPASRVRGVDALEELVAAGLTGTDDGGVRFPVLAEAVPSVENGLWKVLPDGRMETTWKIKPGIQWHDGTAFTSADAVFVTQLGRDRDIPIFNARSYDFVDRVEAPDTQTVTVHWKRPYVDADGLFGSQAPVAKHILEQPYLETKETFIDHPYWSFEWVGAGPYKLKSWERGSHLIVEANDRYALGRPKIDEVEIRFINDANTLAANLLAGAVQLTLGRALSGPQVAELKNQWRDGDMVLTYVNWIAFYPQFINTNPAVVADLTFRRALLHATNRQEQVDTLTLGQSQVAHSWLSPGQPAYREIEERNVTRYEYDPRKALQMIEGLGYTRGADGFLRDRAGQQLALEVRTTAGDDLREKMLLTTTDTWKQLGINATPYIIPRQLADDLEFRATFPAFEITRNPNDHSGTQSLHSSRIALPENQFRVTGNRSRYANSEVDALVDRYLTTIPLGERRQVMGQIVRHMSENLPIMGILYNTSVILHGNRLLNIKGGGGGAWNAHEWDVRN